MDCKRVRLTAAAPTSTPPAPVKIHPINVTWFFNTRRLLPEPLTGLGKNSLQDTGPMLPIRATRT